MKVVAVSIWDFYNTHLFAFNTEYQMLSNSLGLKGRWLHEWEKQLATAINNYYDCVGVLKVFQQYVAESESHLENSKL